MEKILAMTISHYEGDYNDDSNWIISDKLQTFETEKEFLDAELMTSLYDDGGSHHLIRLAPIKS